MYRLTYIIFLLSSLTCSGQPFASIRLERQEDRASDKKQFDFRLSNLALTSNGSVSSRYAVKPVSFNSASMDFSPFPYNSGIVFVSSRPPKGAGQRTEESFLNLFYAEEGENGVFSKPQLLNKENITPYHLGPAVFFNEGKSKIVTRNSFYKQRQIKDGTTQPLELAQSEMTSSGRWSELVTIPLCSPEYSAGHPAVSADGLTLYFSSNMPGTIGGSDIFVSHYANGAWSLPKNLGGMINTPGQELFPYLHNDSILYFSSTNHHSLGGLDVFYCNLKSPSSTVIHLDAPVNSTADDFGVFLDRDALSGFFSTNRSGSGQDDIYYFEEVQQFAQIDVYDSLTGDYVTGARISLSCENVLLSRRESDLMGSTQFRLSRFRSYHASISHPKYTSSTIGLLPAEWPEKHVARVKVYISPLDGEVVAKKSSVALQTTDRKASTNTISFSSAPLDIDVSSESLVEPKELTKVSPIDSVAGPIIKVIVVENVSGLPFIMASKNDSIYEFHAVSTSELGNAELNLMINIPSGAKRNDYENIIRDQAGAAGYHISRFLLIRSFYFDSEKAWIRNDASAQLDKIIEVMVTYADVDVQLIFHSDSRGTNQFNLELSKRRSDEVTDYLTRAGIEKHRIHSQFVGESRLLNDCGDLSDCDELLHQMNRTTEFKLFPKGKTAH